MRDLVTFCIKTIHRPHCCATLVRSIYEYCGDDRPLIYVLDDGKPELRFSQVCPDEAAMVDRLIETEYDIGLSAGRNRLVEAAQTPMVIFADDDHVVGPQTRLNDLVRKFESSRLDLLATRIQMEHRGCSIRQAVCFTFLVASIEASATLPSAHSFATASLRIATSCRRFAGMKISR